MPFDTGLMEYYPKFIGNAESWRIFEELRDTLPWKSDQITLFGQTHLQPRLLCYLAENEELSYSYSGRKLSVVGWRAYPSIDRLAQFFQTSEELGNQRFNSVLCNYYRDGNDSMGYHADDEKELGDEPVIFSVSFGQSRPFHLKPKESKRADKQACSEYPVSESERDVLLGWTRDKREPVLNPKQLHKVSLDSGSLLVMKGKLQQYWKHAIPKSKKVAGGRINLTFRYIHTNS